MVILRSVITARQRSLALFLAVVFAAWSVANPRQFADLWLTPDQQGRLLFERGDYQRAAGHFEDPLWRAISLYAAQDFAAAALAFSQYQDANSLLARGNALAHAREYLDARDAYLELQARYPQHPAPAINLPLLQALIDANRQLSENQQAESGDLSSEQDEGPRSSEGDERLSMLEREQYSAEQLRQDPELTAMWLRQVQRDPAEFLSTKFYLQLEQREGQP